MGMCQTNTTHYYFILIITITTGPGITWRRKNFIIFVLILDSAAFIYESSYVPLKFGET